MRRFVCATNEIFPTFLAPPWNPAGLEFQLFFFLVLDLFGPRFDGREEEEIGKVRKGRERERYAAALHGFSYNFNRESLVVEKEIKSLILPVTPQNSSQIVPVMSPKSDPSI